MKIVFAFISAEEGNYIVKLYQVWKNDLADPESEDYTELEDKIIKYVKFCFCCFSSLFQGS